MVPILHRSESFGLWNSLFRGVQRALNRLSLASPPSGPITSIVLCNQSCYRIPQEQEYLKPPSDLPTSAEYTFIQRIDGSLATFFFYTDSRELSVSYWSADHFDCSHMVTDISKIEKCLIFIKW